MSSCCGSNHEHHHEHNGVLGKNTELYFAILSGVFLFIGFVIEKTIHAQSYTLISFCISIVFGGWYTAIETFEGIKRKAFDIDFLMLFAAIGAIYIDRLGEGALLLFLFSLGHALEEYAMGRAEKSIKALGELSPKTAWLKENGTTREIAVTNLKINDIIVVQPNTKISADGVVIKGSTSVNQAAITGESIPVDKVPISSGGEVLGFENVEKENKVFTGTINGNNVIEVRVLRLNKDSTISRLIKMVSDAEEQKSPTQLLAKKFEKWYVPTVIFFVIALCFTFLIMNESFSQSLYRAITVLVAASPCALAISTPSAVLSGIARAAQKGVLVKGGRALEDLGSLTTIAFDKTGTLTQGKPQLTGVTTFNEFSEKEFLKIVLGVEQLSNHPLARAISRAIKEKYKVECIAQTLDIKEIQGKGVSAIYNQKRVFIGNEKLMKDEKIVISEKVKKQMINGVSKGQTIMLVAYDEQLIGMLSVMDTPRATIKSTLEKLKTMGVERMIMLTGDYQNVGNTIAQQIGLTEAKGDLLPEDKVQTILDLKKQYGKIAMVGDGVNDAPAMANSTVGVAMGAAGSDVALETADVALMSDKIEKLPFAIGLSRASKAIIKQNIWISMGMIAILVPLTLLGIAGIGPAVILHEGSTLLVIVNALRLLRYKQNEPLSIH